MGAEKIFCVITDSRFTANAGGAKKALKSMMLANLHLFSGKQKKAVEAVVNGVGGSDDKDAAGSSDSDSGDDEPATGRKGRNSSRSSSSSSRRSRSRGKKKR